MGAYGPGRPAIYHPFTGKGEREESEDKEKSQPWTNTSMTGFLPCMK